MALEPLGAWAELVGYEHIRGNSRADMTQDLLADDRRPPGR